MSQHNSLMEWLEQTKKVSKEVDYITLDTIDSIVEALPLIDPKVIRAHAGFFDYFCTRYHKPNPVDLLKKDRRAVVRVTNPCVACANKKSCVRVLSEYANASVARCERATQMVVWQWFEVIDFMYERPELVNPSLLDEYVRAKIVEVCAKHRKNNPLKNGIAKRFGRYWKDDNGLWHKERRNRFS